MNRAHPILQTKLHLPRVRTTLVPRTRLLQCLEVAQQGQVTLVSAPAGSGKTTAVVAWCQQRREQQRVAWVSLDGEDNDPARFLHYVLAALTKVDPELGQGVLALPQSPDSAQMKAILTALINQLSQRINGDEPPIIFILDDYHLIDNPAIHAGMTFLLDNQPRQLHLILISRTVPPLPLARLQSRAMLTEVRTDELRFTVEEGSVFLDNVMGLQLATTDIATLAMRTEGWIAALQFAALSLRRMADADAQHHFIQALSGRDHQLVEYLMAEVVAHQPQRVQNFLLQTAILERFCGSLCDAITDHQDGQSILNALVRANLLIIALDNEYYWFRYHHLFAEFLRHRLTQSTNVATISTLHQKASHWFEAQGLLEEAIDHAFAAQDFGRAAELLKPLLMEIVWQRGELPQVRRWLASFPHEQLRQHPELVAAGVTLHMIGYEPERAAAYLDLLPQTTSLPPFVVSEVTIRQSSILRASGDVTGAIELLQDALAQVTPTDQIPYQCLQMEMVSALLDAEELVASQEIMAEVLEQIERLQQGYLTLEAMQLQGILYRFQGQLLQAYDIYTNALLQSRTETGHTLPPIGKVHLGLAALSFEWQQLTTAAHHLQQAIVLGEQAGIGDILWFGYIAQAQLAQHQGDQASVEETLTKFKRLAQRMETPQGLPYGMTHYTRLEAVLALQRGELDVVGRWADARRAQLAQLPETLDGDHWVWLHYLIIRSRVENERSALPQATALLHHLLKMAEIKGYHAASLRSYILLALVFQAQNKHNDARRALGQALQLGQVGGYLYSFVEQGAPMHMLLEDAHQQGLIPTYVDRLLSAFATSASPVAPTTNLKPDQTDARLRQPEQSNEHRLIEPLTARELDVLQQIASGYSNQEIADHLVLSVNTVRTHIRNAYGKLQVRNRLQAVAVARQLGIL